MIYTDSYFDKKNTARVDDIHTQKKYVIQQELLTNTQNYTCYTNRLSKFTTAD